MPNVVAEMQTVVSARWMPKPWANSFSRGLRGVDVQKSRDTTEGKADMPDIGALDLSLHARMLGAHQAMRPIRNSWRLDMEKVPLTKPFER